MKQLSLFMMGVLLSTRLFAGTQVEPDLALQMLNGQNKLFAKQVVQVSDNVFTAVGYHGANVSMIVGTDGVIIVDTLMGPTGAENAFKALREHSDKPVKAIIYTHSHGDHTGGAKVFAGDDNPDIYALDNFGLAANNAGGLGKILGQRGVRQFGRMLPQSEIINRGLAPANTVDTDRGKGYMKPTVSVVGEKTSVNIAGVDLELLALPGETDDALTVWLPNERVLLAGDNFYQAFPNLYAIRGTAYRNVLNWSDSVAKMAEYKPAALVGGHTTPILGQEQATAALQNYSDAIRSVYDQTVVGINQGKGPELIAQEVSLPKHLQEQPYLTEFYGTVPHAVRAIYAGLIGWFDGNPSTLNPHHPSKAALNMAKLAGGTKKLTESMVSALKQQDYQWALELADHLNWLEKADHKLALETKIKALRGLAQREYNAPNRNYYLSYANELESGKLDAKWF
ncbi:MAG: alkyl/aryl-sulfatase [Gammaproteobacteria bacterium]|nr:alkyl/aryl-sulfatase [Gammaproteobacteria bacterium]